LPFNEWKVGTEITCAESISYNLDAMPTIVYHFKITSIIDTDAISKPSYNYRMLADLLQFGADNLTA
jgi:hypothetical protein